MSDEWAAIDGFSVIEPGTQEECFVTVRVSTDAVLLALGRATDGDVEVGMTNAAARRLAAALQTAVERMAHIEG